MKEIININLGQSGVQMAHATWELYCIEHGIGPDGKVINSDDMDDSSDTLFSRSSHDMFVPRTLFMDLEPNVIDEIRNGAYRNLFHPDLLLTGKEDAANNFARGHYTIGRDKIEVTLDRIRKLVENCENLQGMVLSHSYGGGTGSGFTSLLLERLAIEHSKSAKLEVSVCPSPEFSTSMVEPYNQILNIHTSTENVDISFLMDNQALYDICLNNMNISSPRYCELNRIIAQVMSSVTASTRFDGALNADLNQIQTNLVPYPRIHYPLLRHAPLISKDKADHQKQSVSELTKALFDGSCDMLKLDNKIGKYMSCAIVYRGQVTAKDTNYALSDIKRRSDITFVNWCPTGFKVGLNYQPPVTSVNSFIADSDKCATMMANTTGINQCWETLGNKFDLLFSKRAFVHWYVGDGMEEGEMNEAKEDLSLLIKDYVELNNDGSDDAEAAEGNEAMEYEQAEAEVGEVEEALEGYEGNEGNEGYEANEGNEANEAFEGNEGFEGTEANEMNEAYEEY